MVQEVFARGLSVLRDVCLRRSLLFVIALILLVHGMPPVAGAANELLEIAPTLERFESPVSPYFTGYAQRLSEKEATTVTFEFTLDDVESLLDVDGQFYVIGLSTGQSPVPEIALTAIGNQSWFATNWQLRLEAAPGFLDGDPQPVVLRRGTTEHLLTPGHVYQSIVSYDPTNREATIGLVNVTTGEEIVSGFAFLSSPSSSSDPANNSGFVQAVFGATGEGLSFSLLDEALRLERVTLDHDYRRLGEALSVADAQAIAVKNGEDRATRSVYLRDDSLGLIVTRPFGRLPGQYVFIAEPEGPNPRMLASVSAADLSVFVDLGKQVLPPGTHQIRVMYVQPESGQINYEAVIRDVAVEVIPPQVEAHVDLSLLELVRLDSGDSITGVIGVLANQSIELVSLLVETLDGKPVFDASLTGLTAGLTSIPFTLHDRHPGDLTSPLRIVLQMPGSDPVEKVWAPVNVGLTVGRDFEVIQSYQQPVRRLTRTEASALDALFTYDLLEVRVTSDAVDQDLAGELQVIVTFTSPSGKSQSVSARRLESSDPTQHWVARYLPDEPGDWAYQVELKHPEAIPGGQIVEETTLTVQQGDKSIPAVRRPWGPTMPKPDGKRVSSIRYRRGSTVKLEQLIGDWDNERQIPTLNQTLSDYGYIGTDLGQSFEHDGKLIFLFGDTMGTRGFIESTMAHSVSGNPEEGLRLDIYTDRQGNILAIKPPGLRMGGFEVPSGGMSIDGQMYFVVKDQTTVTAGKRTFRSVLVRYDEENRSFVPVREFSPFGGKFHEVIARVAPDNTPGLPGEGPWMLIWGSGESYRESPLYLAVTRVSDIEKDERMYYFAGLDGDGNPIWSRSESDAVPVVNHRQIGEFSVIWSEELKVWLLTYNSGSPRGIVFRWAEQPWGTWSSAQIIFEPWLDGGYARFMHALTMPNPDLAGPMIEPQPPAVQQWGGEYAPYMIERFTRFRDQTLTIYYLMSTWNPYFVVLMRTDLDVTFTDE